MRRAGALSLALWMSVSLAERVAPAHCPEHDPFGAAMDAMAHHGGGSHGPAGARHPCCCLEECCAAAAMLTPAVVARQIESAAPRGPRVMDPPDRVPPEHPGTRLPFANGPPHALTA